MEYIKLFCGIGLLVVFTWLLLRNSVRKGFIHSLFRLDIAMGMIAGGYLVITSIIAVLA
jgi:general stress protein CsbA